ncbi:post-GPI attachment to proteins factor 6 isoform X4 [Equus quagga]|uniref:post-GPI attachment to proteins factor 6 isoform X4 n=1 Tax=Equus quagga TaxID=89248 RepID=UPI001EE1917F|nr:post-GPI attachment to proteins factor 6 isoform X4 [Equus quagga]
MGRAGTGTGGAAVAVAVAGPLLLLLLLARPPPGAAGDSQKGGPRAQVSTLSWGRRAAPCGLPGIRKVGGERIPATPPLSPGPGSARPAPWRVPPLPSSSSQGAQVGQDRRAPRRGDVRLVSEQFSQSPQKLSFYSWYGSARLFHFRVPPDAVLLRWLLQVSWGSSPTCTNVEITVYFRYGAPPVINPLGTSFPANTSVQPSFFIKMLQSNASVNISHPAPGDWFVVAHLPPSSQKIEVKDFVPTCAYVFQPDMLVVRVVEVSVLEPDVPLPQNLLSHPSYLKIFVPKYTQELRLELQGCVSNGSLGCPVRLTVGSATLPSNFQKVLTCTGPTQACRLLLPSPPWDRWLQVTAKSLAGPHVSVAFSAVAALTACRVWNMNVQPLLPSSLNQSCNISTGLMSPSPSYQDQGRNSRLGNGPFCLMSYAVTREDVDVVSVRFRPLDRVLVLVQSDTPSVMQLYLNTGMDSGGSLTISLWANQSLITKNSWVVACVNAASPFLSFNTSLNCTTAFFQGYPLFLSASSREANLIIPYPETDTWYLSLQLVCPESPEECVEAVVFVESALSLVPCLHDCGPYGQCLLLRRHGYLYAGCSCKAASAPSMSRRPTGWRGWSCTDNSTAQTVAQQKAAALLLTLSNLLFLAPIAVSVYRSLLVEAAVYAYTMFFSTFYHACDQPGEAVLCILNYDTLQYCDFLGSGVSMWVTILCMARLKAALKYVYRCGHRRQCYPTSWQRWVFYLLPGISMATVALAIYTSMMTSDNYYYTHSIWHMLLAGSAAFLLPPRDKHTEPWACSKKLTCHYQICKNHREELYTVT